MTADQQHSRNDTTTAMCKCGHSGFEHENGDNDHICRSCNTCWSFEQVGSAPTDHRQSSDGSDQQRLAQLFADANEKIDKLESDLLNSKIEIVQDLAQKIEKEGLIPIERIANEIVHQLKGRISPTHIRENLGNKYKDSRQSKNAKAKKRNQKVATVALPTKQATKTTAFKWTG